MGSRVVKSKEPHVRITVRSQWPRGEPNSVEISLVRGGPELAYLWIGPNDGPCLSIVSGEKTLRALAKAILKEVGNA